ncbi:MAG TPA: response regulator [Woeseiaceae bacterium]|nr:response regulator [Woeseiaceae bacterium]
MNEYEQVEILLVDDNALDAELAMRGLKEHNLANNVVWVKDGEQALDYVYRRGEFQGRAGSGPRLILLDLKMPKIDGIEVTRALKSDEKTRHIPIVIMTSSEEEKDITESYSLGVNSYIVKPLDFDALADVASRAGYYWLAINRVPPS